MNTDESLRHLSPTKQLLVRERLRQAEASSSRGQPELIAFVAAKDTIDERRLNDTLRTKLPQYMLPSRIVRLSQLPHTPNGKIDRRALEKIALEGAAAAAAPIRTEAAQDAVEAQLIAIWKDLLGHERFGKDDSFFDLGGHSLLAIRMLGHINSALQTNLPVALIVEAPTINRLAEAIRARQIGPNSSASTLVALQPEGMLPPLYLLPLHMHGALHYRHLTAQMDGSRPIFAFEAFDLREREGEMIAVDSLAQEYVDQLLRHQPQGPYYLCGISVAGLLAFEMARILKQRGIHDVEVILLDTYGPSHPQKAGISGQAAFRHMVSPANAVDWSLAMLGKARTALKKRTKAGADMPPKNHEADLGRALAFLDDDFVNTRLGEIIHAYLSQERSFDGHLHLIRAKLEAWDNRYDPTLGWQRFVRGNIHVRHVRGDHLGILRRLYVKATAEQVSAILGDCDVMYGNESPSQSL